MDAGFAEDKILPSSLWLLRRDFLRAHHADEIPSFEDTVLNQGPCCYACWLAMLARLVRP